MSEQEITVEQDRQPAENPEWDEKLVKAARAYDERVEQAAKEGFIFADYQRPANYPPSAFEPRPRCTGSAARVGKKKEEAKEPQKKYMPEAELDEELARLEELSQAAQAGETTALDKLRAQLDECPHIWQRLGDLQLAIENEMAGQIAEQDPLKLEAFRKRNSIIRRQLQDQSDAAYVKMAVSQLVACWIFIQFLELRALESGNLEHEAKQLVHAQRRLEAAHRAFAITKRLEQQLSSQAK